MNVVILDLDRIDDTDRMRPVDMAYAQILAESINEVGQLTPIDVAPARGNGRHKLAAGAHRMAAMRILGRTTIEAIIRDGSDNDALLREIDENLCRHDLNELDRAIFLGKRKEVYDRLHPQAKFKNSDKNQGVAQDANVLRFTLETAQTLKTSERLIQKLVHRYKHLDPSVRARLQGTWLATKGSELDAIARLDADDQVKIVDYMLREHDPQPTVHAAKIELRGITQRPRLAAERQLEKLKSLWERTDPEAAQMFRDWLKRPESRKGGR
jgi:ParB family chromosome partitioning protein